MPRESSPQGGGRSRWQREYDALPDWAQLLVDALRLSCGHGSAPSPSINVARYMKTVLFNDAEGVRKWSESIVRAIEFADAQSAPYPPPSPDAFDTAANVVEAGAMAYGDDVTRDQPCAFGMRVEGHAVYCHHGSWPDRPRKCWRDREDYLHEDCAGFVPNPHVPQD